MTALDVARTFSYDAVADEIAKNLQSIATEAGETKQGDGISSTEIEKEKSERPDKVRFFCYWYERTAVLHEVSCLFTACLPIII